MSFVFKRISDEKGNDYFNCYSNIETDTVFCIDNKNIVLKGTPKIVARTGKDSKFGEQIIFSFLVKERLEEYKADSEHETLEYYLPLNDGIKFLEESLFYLKKHTKNDKKDNDVTHELQ